MRHLAQEAVARGLAEGLVDRLEAVDVHEHDRKCLVLAAEARQRVREPVTEAGPVGQTREVVVARHVRRAALEALALEGEHERPAQRRGLAQAVLEAVLGAQLDGVPRAGLVPLRREHDDGAVGRRQAQTDDGVHADALREAQVHEHDVEVASLEHVEGVIQAVGGAAPDHAQARAPQQRERVLRARNVHVQHQQAGLYGRERLGRGTQGELLGPLERVEQRVPEHLRVPRLHDHERVEVHIGTRGQLERRRARHEHERAGRAHLAQTLHHAEAIEPGHAEIHGDDVEAASLHRAQRLRGAVGQLDDHPE